MSNETAITAGRHTKLTLDPQGLPSLLRPGQTIRRTAPAIAAARTPLASSGNVQRVPNVGWMLASLPTERSGTVRFTEAAQVLQPSQVTVPANVGTVNMNPTNALVALPGMTSGGAPPWTGGSVLSFVKQVPAGQNWDGPNNNLAASQAAIPKPTLPTEDLPMDRLLHGHVTHGRNGAFGLGFMIPAGYYGPDNLLNFYFGGETDATNATTGNAITAGRYCLNLRGSSTAVLYEWDGSAWQIRYVFPWTTHVSRHAGTFHLIKVRPFGATDIQFETHEGDSIGHETGGFSMIGAVVTAAGLAVTASQLQNVRTFTYRHTAKLTGAKKPISVTGPGPVLVDVRRDLRIPFHIIQQLYAPLGVLIDLPFSIDFPVLGLSTLTLTADSYLPPGTALAGTIIDALSGTALLAGAPDPLTGAPTYLTNAGSSVYAVRMDLASDSTRTRTPIVRAWSVNLDSQTVVRTTTPITAGHEASGSCIRRVSVTGPDLTADHETASLTIEDASAKFSNHLSTGILENRGRVPAKIGVYDDNGALISWLFAGEVARCEAVRKGKKVAGTYVPTLLKPESEYRELDIQLVGMWARLADQINFSLLTYWQDDAYLALTGQSVGWKVTDIIRDLFTRHLGFPASYLDIPDNPLRMWMPGPPGSTNEGYAAEDKEAWQAQPGVKFSDLIDKLVRDYLGQVLLFDPNAGANGMWRLIAQPQLGAAYGFPFVPPPVASFVGYPTSPAGKLTTSEKSYAANQTFIRRGTLRTSVDPPECNYVLVLGFGAQVPAMIEKDPSAFKAWASIVNPASNDFPGFGPSDPTSPDYLGRFVPVVHCDPLLSTKEACAWVARRIYDQAAHARGWVKWQSPLLLITDPNDALQVRPRPLRVGDVVTVSTGNAQRTCVMRSCAPDYTNDQAQLAHYEALIVN